MTSEVQKTTAKKVLIYPCFFAPDTWPHMGGRLPSEDMSSSIPAQGCNYKNLSLIEDHSKTYHTTHD